MADDIYDGAALAGEPLDDEGARLRPFLQRTGHERSAGIL